MANVPDRSAYLRGAPITDHQYPVNEKQRRERRERLSAAVMPPDWEPPEENPPESAETYDIDAQEDAVKAMRNDPAPSNQVKGETNKPPGTTDSTLPSVAHGTMGRKVIKGGIILLLAALAIRGLR